MKIRLLPFSTRWLKRLLPASLFARTLLIIVIPTILALIVATFVFFDRHWVTTTHRLTHAVAADISVVVEMLDLIKDEDQKTSLINLADRKMDLSVTYEAGGHLSKRVKRYASPLRDMLRRALDERVGYPHLIDMRRAPDMVAVQVEIPDGLYTFYVPQRRIYTPTTEVFIGWMIGSSILLSGIALLFMRNQIRPVRRLAEAAEAIGKGQDVPWFKLEGATEVRQASAALMVMRDRIRRSMGQRTAMLAGVSHDLRTPLTRMKLQLAMMPESAQTRGFVSDIADMEKMLEAYLSFARGEEAEPAAPVDLPALLQEIADDMKRQNVPVALKIESACTVVLRPHAMKRCIANLVGNAARYGKNATVTLALRDHAVDIVVDDDGAGIPPEKREDVFRPFIRLDESRNMDTGGVGLGLTIARDIARNHGGDVVLEDSPMGGLRARIWLPV
ncbi:MAG TPA: two-component sensor histidine kinase [Rhodospirillaceae bacterium]|nr:two-component sensor histidine kinase [Rhodospirillaceae bacterium]